jgi:hypothetical protein
MLIESMAYFSGLCLREYPHIIWSYMVQYLHFRILEFPLIEPPIEALFLSLLCEILDLLFPGKDCLGGAPEILRLESG